jgi:hypothetical protein
MFTAQGAQLPLRTKSAAKVLLFFDIGKLLEKKIIKITRTQFIRTGRFFTK